MKKKPPRVCEIEAPCKINLHLRIREKRPDGFHRLESLFASLALADGLRVELSRKSGCRFSAVWELSPESIPPEKNLVLRAVSLFRERTGFDRGLDIRLVKRVPASAGLGGGSSDAAAALRALDLLAGTALPFEELDALAASLGSDAPFFLRGGAAYVSGRGESIAPVKAPEGLRVVLVKPPFPSGTASAYRLLDRAREAGIVENSREETPKEGLIKALSEDPGSWPFGNDFLPAFLAQDPSLDEDKGAAAGAYKGIFDSLRGLGASFSGLSGSGSCCFGVFTSRKAAENAEKALSGKDNYVKSTFFLARNGKTVLK